MHADTTLFHKVEGGLVDARAWTSPLEGAYTRVAKLAILNALDAPALLKIVFNRRPASASYGPVHTHSFLSGEWVDRSESRPQAQWVRGGFLDHLCGRWATRIAGDQRLRLCCRCADMGFQSSLFQIDALTNCPIHNTPLIDCCPHCSEPTPRYALTVVGFDTPMQCVRCSRGYGCSWTGAAEVDLWREPAGMSSVRTL